MRTRASSLLVIGLLFAAACGDSGSGGDGPSPTATPTPTPPVAAEQLDGVYDSNRGLVIVTIASVTTLGGTDVITLDFGLVREAFISVTGFVGSDGSSDLVGAATHEDTGATPANGHVVAGCSDIECRIDGTIDASPLEAVRPRSGTSPRFSGRYSFLFDIALNGTGQSSAAVVDIDVPASGRGHSLAAADEVDAAGTRLGTLAVGKCVVSAMGNLQCRFPYHGIGTGGPFGGPSVFDAVLEGQLVTGPLGVPEGQGVVIVTKQAPITAHAFPFTAWTAILQPAP